jgi:hypothetical protein
VLVGLLDTQHVCKLVDQFFFFQGDDPLNLREMFLHHFPQVGDAGFLEFVKIHVVLLFKGFYSVFGYYKKNISVARGFCAPWPLAFQLAGFFAGGGRSGEVGSPQFYLKTETGF